MKNMTAKVLFNGLLTNLFLSLLQIVVGLIGSSMAVVSDGVHTFSDLLTDGVAIIGDFLSKRPEDEKHPFGHGMIEYLTSLVIGFVIISMGLFIIYNSFNSKLIIPSKIVMFVTVITIISKSILSKYILINAKKYNSAILLASGNESHADVTSSLFVLISALLVQLSLYYEPFKYADMIAAVCVSIIIIHAGYEVVSSSISGLLGERETNQEVIDSIIVIINDNELVEGIKSLILVKYGPYYKLMLEVLMDKDLSLKTVHDAIDKLEKKLIKHGHVRYISIKVSPK